MGLALYRKYRSKQLADIVGQEHIKHVLQTALKQNALHHAYLFTGPRGVGKTSIARILAHEINKLAYDDETTHLDIIEIDAASNRRIDEIRDLRDKVHIAPTSAKYKIYIIDEVHMLTKEAFNALLKTLEEPPEHVIFILATTEAHKVPATIISRTQRFTFQQIPTDVAVAHLAEIAEKEGISIDTASLTRIVEHSQGSLRDSLNMLDQISSAGTKITVETVTDLLGIPNQTIIDQLIESTLGNKPSEILSLLDKARIEGTTAATIATHMSANIREQILLGTSASKQLIELLEKLLQVSQSSQPFTMLELALLSYAMVDIAPAPRASIIETKKTDDSEQVTAKSTTHITESKPAIKTDTFSDSWKELLRLVKEKHNTLYSVLRMADPKLTKNELVLTFSFGFHQKQVETSAHKATISRFASEIFGNDIHVTTRVVQKDQKVQAKEQVNHSNNQDSKHLKDVSNIFEGAELIE
ncbi:DNA polymerase III subunit gamma/tau [bacterium]|nr:DNA polymerase III subunit gamma/tau [bacterium]NBX98648.1 DNA polymerase III subunit gamma/tau [bacterium]NDC94085.1 DNA polymerase III subunit gamma/tau [bacterium]NDD83531.1 DNA polymerase III subunit gamma/tau [bacterium]NDG29332.1 DNA polymerase III subunit gamma/tau [bacterium]